MCTTLLPPAQWAQMEFALAELGDRRRTDRLVNIATRLAQNPGGTLPQALPDWSELKAAYRFFSQPQNGYEQVQGAHWQRTRQQCRQPGEYLLIEDTTALDYSARPAREDLGTIGDGRGRGLLLHSTLAVQVQSWNGEQRPEGIALGLAGQQCHSRSSWPQRPQAERRSQRPWRARESQRWAAMLEPMGRPPSGSQWIYIADREADFYEPIQRCQRQGIDFVIRACQDRRLASPAGHLKEVLAQAPLLGQMTVKVRARPGQSARTASVQVRAMELRLDGPWRPGGWQPDFAANAVEVREVDAPQGVEALHWILLTSLPCGRWAQVQRIIGRYTARWWVEEYHKALKSGVGVEDSRMERAYRLESLVAVLAIVAVRLLNAKLLAQACADQPVQPEVFGPEALAILAERFGKPSEGWTHRSALVAVARLGGFLARKHDGSPGWQTIWRGWQRLMWMCEGLETLQLKGKRCG
jgi:hypothetical protein